MKKLFCMMMTLLVVAAMLQGCAAKNGTAETPQPSETVETNTPNGTAETSQPSETVETNTPNGTADDPQPSKMPESYTVGSGLSEDMAYEGISNYCHSEYDWSIAEDNPSIMYVEMGEETETEYQVIFRSYTGSFKYFYVDKTTGITRLVDYVPSLGIEEDAGTIDLFDYLEDA